jgi:hypothetical protein
VGEFSRITQNIHNGLLVNVNWNNTNNVGANIKSITIKIKNSSGAFVAEDTRTITVKHIGTIGSINVNGTNVGDGGSSNLPCGTGSITISSAVPATDPSSAVSYNWALPSGWTTANTTTTTNSITVTPSTNGGGNVGVTANRTDGTTTQSASITVTRPTVPQNPPLITSFGAAQGTMGGGVLLCTNANFTNSTVNEATEYRWSTTGGTLVNGGTSAIVSGTTSPTISATSDGTISVQAYSSTCGNGSNTFSYTIYYGAPDVPSITLNGSPFSGSTTICRNTSQLLAASENRAQSLSWSVLSGSNVNLYVQSSFSATINPQNAGFVSIGTTASNCFGNNNATSYFIVNNCGGFRIIQRLKWMILHPINLVF